MSEISLTYLLLFQSCCLLQIGSALIFPARPGLGGPGRPGVLQSRGCSGAPAGTGHAAVDCLKTVPLIPYLSALLVKKLSSIDSNLQYFMSALFCLSPKGM